MTSCCLSSESTVYVPLDRDAGVTIAIWLPFATISVCIANASALFATVGSTPSARTPFQWPSSLADPALPPQATEHAKITASAKVVRIPVPRASISDNVQWR